MIEIPVIESPDILHELLSESRSMFYRGQYRQFCRNVIASWASPTRSVAHLNGISVEHTNQINLNRFLGNIDTLDIFRKSVELINRFCTDPVLVLDDAVLQRPGRHIDGAGWLYDHNEGKTVRGMSAVTAAVAGNVGYFPLNIDTKPVRKREKTHGEGKEVHHVKDHHADGCDQEIGNSGSEIPYGTVRFVVIRSKAYEFS